MMSKVRILILAVLLVGMFFAGTGQAQVSMPGEGSGAEKNAEQALTREALEGLFAVPQDDFIYKIEGRSDPFVPFISDAIVETEIKIAEEELTGMRKFEPGQLTLVAIVAGEKSSFAMVQDAAGKGYVLRKGTKIGRTGEVVDIIPNKVIIQQQSYTATQRKRVKTVEMVLKKEGEKKQ